MSRSSQPSAADELAVEAARLAAEQHCEDVVVLDLRGLSPVTDFFVICTGTSDRQMRAVADSIEDHAEMRGHTRLGRAGYDTAQWVLLDFVDVVVHLFDAERRSYYDLEMLWGDAKRIEWNTTGPGSES